MIPNIFGSLGRYGKTQLRHRQWMGLQNASGYRRQQAHPLLTDWPAGADVLRQLKQNGIASFHLEDMPGGSETMDHLFADYAREEAAQRQEIDRRRSVLESGASDGTYKTSLLSWYPGGAVPPFEHPLAQWALRPEILSLVNSYYGFYARLLTLKYWYSVAARNAVADGSQMWHRDYNDFSMVKSFIYVNDVTASGGPFSYARGTHRGWLRGTDPRFVRDSHNSKRVTDAEMAEFAGKKNLTTVTGRAGTVLITDVSGFHKGGFATEDDRRMIVVAYVSPNCRDRIDSVVEGVPADAHPSVRFAARADDA